MTLPEYFNESACDATHITGELVDGFLPDRLPLNVIGLASNPAVLTAWACGQPGGVLPGIGRACRKIERQLASTGEGPRSALVRA